MMSVIDLTCGSDRINLSCIRIESKYFAMRIVAEKVFAFCKNATPSKAWNFLVALSIKSSSKLVTRPFQTYSAEIFNDE
jgi:hypothetical protein